MKSEADDLVALQRQHEEGLAHFIQPNRRERFSLLAGGRKQRSKILFELDHFKWFDPQCCRSIANSDQTYERILKVLYQFGAPEMCWTISGRREFDARYWPLKDAVSDIWGMGNGTMISLVVGKLGYYEGEFNCRWILTKP